MEFPKSGFGFELASAMIESGDKFYFLNPLKSKEVMYVLDKVIIEIRLQCIFLLDNLKGYITTNPKELSKFYKIEYLEQGLTTQHNVIFPGFKMTVFNNPFKSFSVIINEGMVSEGRFNDKNLLFEPLVFNFEKAAVAE
jgi:hypothetical protein